MLDGTSWWEMHTLDCGSCQVDWSKVACKQCAWCNYCARDKYRHTNKPTSKQMQKT